MNISPSKAEVFTISDVKDLDLVTVFIQDLGPGRGKLTVECYGHAWSTYWGGMGDQTVRQFLLGVDTTYVATKLVSGLQRVVTRREERWVGTIVDAVLRAIREEHKAC